MAANSTGLLLFLAQLAEEGCKPSAIRMLGVASVLPRQRSWTFASFQVMLQNQNSILQEVAAKIFSPFPTGLPLFIVSIKCFSNTECSCSSSICVSQGKCLSLRHTLCPIQKSKFV